MRKGSVVVLFFLSILSSRVFAYPGQSIETPVEGVDERMILTMAHQGPAVEAVIGQLTWGCTKDTKVCDIYPDAIETLRAENNNRLANLSTFILGADNYLSRDYLPQELARIDAYFGNDHELRVQKFVADLKSQVTDQIDSLIAGLDTTNALPAARSALLIRGQAIDEIQKSVQKYQEVRVSNPDLAATAGARQAIRNDIAAAYAVYAQASDQYFTKIEPALVVLSGDKNWIYSEQLPTWTNNVTDPAYVQPLVKIDMTGYVDYNPECNDVLTEHNLTEMKAEKYDYSLKKLKVVVDGFNYGKTNLKIDCTKSVFATSDRVTVSANVRSNTVVYKVKDRGYARPQDLYIAIGEKLGLFQ